MFLNCGKQYGSEASLKNHRKIKHGVQLMKKGKINLGRHVEENVCHF
jgi:hypothetical protein